MTEATDIKALRDQFKSIRDDVEFYEDNQHCIVVPIKLAKALLDQLEAECQRAESLSKSEWKMAGELSEAQAELAALKGDQVPFGYVEHQAAVKVVKGETRFAALTMEPKGDKCLPLFTAPQNPAGGDQVPVAEVLSQRIGNDTSTIDKALPTGTKLFNFPQKPVVLHDERDHYQDTDEYEQGYVRGWNASRMEAKAAIEAAGGIVNDGE